jgi:Chaperone of endosialidase
MEPPRWANSWARNIHLSIGAFIIALFIAGTAGAVGAQENTSLGTGALVRSASGSDYTALGFDALSSNIAGSSNTAVGADALRSNSTNPSADPDADFNTAIRVAALSAKSAGGDSTRYKRDIRDMGESSDRLMKLRPVTFRYTEDPAGTVRYGLVAEEVARVYPELVTNGDDGKPETVAYYQLPAMLLNELQKQVRENQRKDAQIAALQTQVGSLQKQAARIDGLIARLSALGEQARSTRPERPTAAMR